MTILGIIFLIIEIGLIGYIISMMIKNRSLVIKDNVVYLAISFVILYLLYTTSTVSLIIDGKGGDIFNFFANVNSALEGVAFKLDLELVRVLTTTSKIFFVDYLLAVCLTTITTILTIFSLIKNRVRNSYKVNKIFKNKGDIILGDSKTARDYLKNNPNSLIYDDTCDYKELINANITVFNSKLDGKTLANKLKKNEHHLILFKDSSYSYSDILELYEETVKIRVDKKINLDENNALFLHIEANIEEMPAINEQFISNVSKESNSYVSCFNKYELFARKFVMDHPITKYLPSSFLDSKNYSLKANKAINVVFVGFGKVNLELLKMMAMDFQFASYNKKDKRFYVNQVNYHIYDNNENNLDENVIATLNTNLDKLYKGKDLEKIEKVCNVYTKKANVYAYSTKEEIENLINDDSYTYIVVSLASDLENVAYAQSLVGELENNNYKVFARVKEDALYKEKEGKNIDNHIIYFGKEDILNHENIVNEKLIEFAQRTNLMYSDNAPLTKKDILKWQSIILVKQYANIYQALSMFFKLNLLGFDLSLNENDISISKDEFEKVCPKVEFNDLSYADYFKDNVYNLLGFIEHSRWNAHYFLSGYKPMNFSEFEPKNGESRSSNQRHGIIKKHACLTSNYNGLDKLIKTQYLMDKYGSDYSNHKIEDISEDELKSEEFKKLAKTYYYDFMVFNDIYDIFTTLGYKIIKK